MSKLGIRISFNSIKEVGKSLQHGPASQERLSGTDALKRCGRGVARSLLGAAARKSGGQQLEVNYQELFLIPLNTTIVTQTFLKKKMSMLRSDVQKLIQRLNGMFRVKAGRGWINWLLKVSYSLRGGMTSGVARSAVGYMSYLQRVYRCQGSVGVVILTKSLYVLTMQAMAGRQACPQDLGPGVARARSGLPRIIPRQHRSRIINGDRFLLRLWLSWFSIYRILEIPGRLKLETITQPGVALSNSL